MRASNNYSTLDVSRKELERNSHGVVIHEGLEEKDRGKDGTDIPVLRERQRRRWITHGDHLNTTKMTHLASLGPKGMKNVPWGQLERVQDLKLTYK